MSEADGIAFPFRIDPETGGVAWASGMEKIRQDVRILLGTRHGERPMLRDFGTRIHSLVHEPNDEVLSDLLRKQAHEALAQWERRIIVTRAAIARSGGELRLIINYLHTDAPISAEMSIPLG
jgi:phage baseplate assembly protein W